jgi:hypothetical protein
LPRKKQELGQITGGAITRGTCSCSTIIDLYTPPVGYRTVGGPQDPTPVPRLYQAKLKNKKACLRRSPPVEGTANQQIILPPYSGSPNPCRRNSNVVTAEETGTQLSRFITSKGFNIWDSACRTVMNERLEISGSVETGIMALLFAVCGGELRP